MYKQNRLVIVSLCFAALSLASIPSIAQAQGRNGGKSHVSLELGGQALIYSLNYEYRLQDMWTFRVGFGSWPSGSSSVASESSSSSKFFAVPLSIGALIGGRAHMLDLSAGVSWVLGDWLPAANVGYRYIGTSGLVGRVFVTPVWDTVKGQPFVWGGLSGGISF